MTERPNAAQTERWSGAAGRHWLDYEAAYDRQLEQFGTALVAGAALGPDDRVLDVGCGTGATTLAAAATARSVLGIDLSALMVERAQARARSAAVDRVEFRVADAQTVALPEPVDVVISRFGVMFFDDPRAAFANLRRALAAAGGRLAVECWQGLERNDWMRIPAEALARVTPLADPAEPGQPGPFSLGDPETLRSVLVDAGWRAVTLDPVTAPVLVGGGGSLDEIVAFLRGGSLGRSALTGVSADVERRALDALRETLAEHETPAGVSLPGAAWLARAGG